MKYGYVFLIIILLGCVYVWISRERKQQKQKQSEYEENRLQNVSLNSDETIFISLPCYSDERECAQTLFDIYNNSDCPWRITVGILHHYVQPYTVADLENSDTTVDTDNTFTQELNMLTEHIVHLYEHLCTQNDASSFSQNIKINILPASEALGAFSARARIEREMFRNEKYYMTTNCRTRFLRGWDTTLLKMYKNIGHPKAILTTVPMIDVDESRPTYVVVKHLDADGFPIVQGTFFAELPVRAFQSILYSPALSFAKSNLVREVPYPIHFPYASSHIESYLMSALYFTHGWRFFTPKECISYINSTILPKAVPVIPKDALHLRQTSLNRAYTLLRRGPCRICRVAQNEHEVGHLFEHDTLLTGVALGSQTSLDLFENYCGIQVATDGEDDVRAPYGIVSASEEEQVCKFGKVFL